MHDTVNPRKIKFQDYTLKGVSTAGIGTCVTVPEWRLAFDVAQGLPFAVSMHQFLITHLHQDHAAGIPYLISQKAMQSHPTPQFFVPEGTEERIRKIIRLWEELEDHQYEFQMEELRPGRRQHLDKDLHVESFATKHRVSCQGYTVFLQRKHLAKQYQHLEKEKIIELRRQGVDVEEYIFIPKISFTGDTQVEFLDLSPEVMTSETLVMEVTYYDDRKSVDSARQWGHIHFEEVISRIPKIAAKNIVWIHMSARYTHAQIQRLIAERLPDDAHRIHLL